MIRLENINKSYGNNFALKNISLAFKGKETVAVIGPSGSGKSTLLRLINRLDTPSSGKIIINNEELTTKNSKWLCLKIGMVFQNFNLFPHLNVLDNLIYSPVKVLGHSKLACAEKAQLLLTKFNLKDKLPAKPCNLSGGQKQRVAIARALMMDPEIILLDEPTSALDPEVIKDVIEAILLLKEQMTLIIVTHHLKFAKAIADRIVFLDHGQMLADQPAAEFFHKPSSHRARLFLENIGDLM